MEILSELHEFLASDYQSDKFLIASASYSYSFIVTCFVAGFFLAMFQRNVRNFGPKVVQKLKVRIKTSQSFAGNVSWAKMCSDILYINIYLNHKDKSNTIVLKLINQVLAACNNHSGKEN